MKYFQLLLLSTLLILSSCGKDDIVPSPNNPNPSNTSSGDISGLVLNESGAALEQVTLTVLDQTVTTNEAGYFHFSNLSTSDDGLLAVVSKEGYLTGYKFVFPEKETKAATKITLVKKKLVGKFNASNSSSLSLNGNATVDFKANSIIDSNGNLFSGEVNVYGHWYNPETFETLASMPGDLRGMNLNNEEVQLATMGMVSVEIFSSSGEELQIAQGQTAALSFPLSSEMKAQAPDQIPLWSFDESNGTWVEEGIANLTEEGYVADVPHFSFWNCDASFPVVGIVGTLVNSNDQPIPNYPLSIHWDGTFYGGYGYTNSQGVFKGKVPRDVPLTLKVWHCGVTLLEENIGVISSEENIGEFTVDLTDFAKEVSGRILDCFGAPINDGYVVATTNYTSEILLPDNDGNIYGIISGCGNNEIILKSYDPNELTTSPIITLPADNVPHDFGDLTICDNLQEYIRFSINGGVNNVIDVADVYSINGDLTYVGALGENTEISARFGFTSIETGTHTGTSAQFGGFIDDVVFQYLRCDPDINNFGCSDFEFEIQENASSGSWLVGTMTGTMAKDTTDVNNISTIDGSFRLEIDRSFNTGTIEGVVWSDENNNGIRESNEPAIPDVYLYITGTDHTGLTNFGLGPHGTRSDENGYYAFEGLMPDVEYRITATNSFWYELTAANMGGDDSIDSDFTIPAGGSGTPSVIISNLSDGATISNIDLGYFVEGMSCNANSYNCPEEAVINVSISGGIPPYTATLSTGETQSGTHVTFENISQGTYNIDVVDSEGIQSNCSVYVPLFRNRITGSVWVDDPFGDPNIKDNTDIKLKGFEVSLVDTNGNIISTEQSDNNATYSFDELPPGEYQIKVDLPANYNFLQTGVGNVWEDSDIDPTTGLSEILTVTGCQDFFDIDIGLKE